MAMSVHHATKHSVNPLWEYAIKQYSKPSIEVFLLDAQDQLNVNVNILLYIAWLAEQRRVFKKCVLQQDLFIELEPATCRVRALRRTIKPHNYQPLCAELKHLELHLEKITIDLLLSQFGQMPHFLSEGFAEIVTRSMNEYFTYLHQPICETWLNAFIQHVKP